MKYLSLFRSSVVASRRARPSLLEASEICVARANLDEAKFDCSLRPNPSILKVLEYLNNVIKFPSAIYKASKGIKMSFNIRPSAMQAR
jgi:hypothetical protein